MISAHQIHAELQRRFARAVAPLLPVQAGERPEIQIDPTLMHAIGHVLHDEPLNFTHLSQIRASSHATGCALRYFFFSPEHGLEFILRTEHIGEHPVAMTLADIYPSAQWHEDELEASCNIQFQSHPDCTLPGCVMRGRGTRCLRLGGAPAPFEA